MGVLLPSNARRAARVLTSSVNSAMVLYIYAAHLATLEWDRFGSFGQAAGSHRVWELLRLWQVDEALDHLRLFTFSEAMLQNLSVYMVIGTPVAITYYLLEHDRVRWLQGLVRQCLPAKEASKASWWLELYLRSVAATFACTLLIARFHLGWPKGHYFVAGCAFSFGCTSISLYLAAPVDFAALAAGAASAGGSSAFHGWAQQVESQVRPALKLVLWLHVGALLAGVWKVSSICDDNAALAFGIMETVVIMGYQLFQGVFVIDDAMVGRNVALAKCLAGPADDCPKAKPAEPAGAPDSPSTAAAKAEAS